ncbi:serine hydrolase domain-containing protein [Novosphingobium taihuense]|uniref:Beta-lactamase-related domain-containing protein n=1 Tax=Novosphingobium taihuense TaxID=260085 RepID=A0A7W7EU95_9SPHN|nr:serine hydrolase [Novosphingobium taihuense]MBB4614178.1 hypothetical protein [Novosphingobium taihuense]TWH87028.1 hypothetical protein IQ25_01305 [Novosphingobium taihuense]
MSRIRKLLAVALASGMVLGPVGPALATDEAPSHAMQELRRIFFADPRINMLTFHNMDEIFHTLPVRTRGKAKPMARAELPIDFSYSFRGETVRAEDFLERSFTNALLIIKDDRIVYERYRNLTGPQTKFLSMSMAKSITSILIGAAVQDGLITSVDDQVVAYVPELKGTAYDGVTIKDTLLMRSGIERSDRYDPDPNSEMTRLREATMIQNTRRATDEALTVKRRDEPGARFNYSTLNTTVLGWIIEKASGKTLPEYMSRRLWQPLGAEADGFFITDGPPGVGRATNGMGYNAVLRDYGRIGQMMLHNGKANGRQIIPAAWVRESTVPIGPEPADGEQTLGYQYQWWTLVNSNAYMAVGLQGQFIYVDPDTRTVVVKLSYFPLGNETPSEESEAFFRAVSSWKPASR